MAIAKRPKKKHGPGFWVCWACADIITNGPLWKNKMWIWSGLSQGGPCARCKKLIKAGQHAAKVTLDAPLG